MGKPKVKILVIGGTIDDLDYTRAEDAPKNHQSVIPDLIERARIKVDYSIEILMQKDSRFITDEDRKLILEKCQKIEEESIIITHGSFTMPNTAKLLGKANLNKTIILFGAAIPANKDNSDAQFNLGAAFTASLILPHGVYLIMHGEVFNWDNVRKNLSTGYFEEEEI